MLRGTTSIHFLTTKNTKYHKGKKMLSSRPSLRFGYNGPPVTFYWLEFGSWEIGHLVFFSPIFQIPIHQLLTYRFSKPPTFFVNLLKRHSAVALCEGFQPMTFISISPRTAYSS